MRLLVLAAVVLLGGCLDSGSPATPEAAFQACQQAAATDVTLYLDDGHTLARSPGPSGATPGTDLAAGFVEDDLITWDSQPLGTSWWVAGNVTFDVYIQIDGPSPFTGGNAGDSLHLYVLWGGEAFSPETLLLDAPTATLPGQVVRFQASFASPPGGVLLDKGEPVRLLVTSLAAGDPGHTILHGGETASHIVVPVRCAGLPPMEGEAVEHVVALAGNGGLFTGAAPAVEGVNRQTIPLEVTVEMWRIDIALRQGDDAVPGKDDLDLVLLRDGDAVWSAGSPYSNETMRLGRASLAALGPGTYEVQVNSYSGAAYEGDLTVTTWVPA